MAGITWVGLLYYFNFVQVPALKAASADGTAGGITKHVAPRALNYFLTMSATYPDDQSGQGFITKVAPLGNGVYSLLHTRMFQGAPELMPEIIRRWLVETLKQMKPKAEVFAPVYQQDEEF